MMIWSEPHVDVSNQWNRMPSFGAAACHSTSTKVRDDTFVALRCSLHTI